MDGRYLIAAPYRFQFLGIPPKGEQYITNKTILLPKLKEFPISRDPPEGGT